MSNNDQVVSIPQIDETHVSFKDNTLIIEQIDQHGDSNMVRIPLEYVPTIIRAASQVLSYTV